MKIQTLLKESNEQLIYYSKTYKLDVEILLSEAIKKNREYLIINCKKKVKNKNIKLFKKMLHKRKKGEPIAYILNKKEFWRNNFYFFIKNINFESIGFNFGVSTQRE